MFRVISSSLVTLLAVCLAGCHSPYYADQGALAGGLGGAGLGALIGSASGHTGAGAAIGAAAGALTGGAVGGALDNIDAKNRAQIAAATGHPPTAVSVNDIVAMTRSGIDEQIIVNQLATSGLQRPLQANDVIYLQQNGVSPHVISIMQQTRVAVASPPPGAVVVPGGPPPVVVADPYWGPGYYRPYYGPRVGVTYIAR
ncbi:MAG TPA: glycine zipper domain-containing protein [Pirellulales bacterium]|nr:glycine zipper domain-containing protein [Pirellulales bacterium]